MDKATQKIYITNNYDKFKTLEGNRQISEGHVKKIMKSIFINGWLCNPIKVNENMEIVDGQHRFEACKRMAIPIQYYISPNESSQACRIMNDNQRGWRAQDRMTNEAANGNQAAKTLLMLASQYSEYKPEAVFLAFTKKYDNKSAAFNVELVDNLLMGEQIMACMDALRAAGCKVCGSGTVRAVKVMQKMGADMKILTDSINKFGEAIIGDQSIATQAAAYYLLTKVYNHHKSTRYVEFPPFGSRAYKMAVRGKEAEK